MNVLTNEIDTLRFTTAGSVDDGKSTLIGRLLYDSKSILEDQIAAVARTSEKRGHDGLDLSLLTDGLTAEREQGITIDVAYRYFTSAKRRFIIADTPGHEQYTRNMVTGASTADVSVIVLDAARGIQPQSRRHAAVASLLDIPHVVVAVNKMDLVGYAQDVFERIKKEFQALARELGVREVSFIPVSALAGDMVVTRGEHLSWYGGPTLLEFLETVRVDAAVQPPFRFPVQLVSRVRFGPNSEHRGYLGRVESGRVRVGDRVLALPSGQTARVREIITVDGNLDSAIAPDSVTISLDRQIDLSRGDFLVDAVQPPKMTDSISANVCWLDAEPLSFNRRYLLKHQTRTVRAAIKKVESRFDVNTLQAVPADGTLAANDLGRLSIRTAQPLFIDPYWANHATGGFILIDEASNATVAAGTFIVEAKDA